ncbi:MAG: hypothetical protein JXR71_12870 [Bacteroidales bacterium]|nr:hypothetical protein [Bacteroidales bacterium]
MTANWIDISKWNNKPDKFFSQLQKEIDDREPVDIVDLRKFNIDLVNLYCLFKKTISPYPNGFYTFLIKDKPIANLFWWDFILESEFGFLHFFRKQSHVEVMTCVSEKEFDLKSFIEFNLKKYAKDIEEEKTKLETHTLYINHYDSYKKCVEELWLTIKDLKIDPIDLEEEVQKDSKRATALMQTYMENNVKFHTLGKSLILNAAFMIESYLNFLIRITAKPELRDYPEVMKKYLSNNFIEKLKSLKFYTILLSENVDLDNKAIKDAQKVMTYRNKYVHFDLSSELNKIGVVHFDNYFPVFPAYNDSPIIENVKLSFQIPSYDIIQFSHEACHQFVKYIDSLLIPNEWSDGVRLLMSQNPIGFNEQKRVYSAIFSNVLFDGFLGKK